MAARVRDGRRLLRVRSGAICKIGRPKYAHIRPRTGRGLKGGSPPSGFGLVRVLLRLTLMARSPLSLAHTVKEVEQIVIIGNAFGMSTLALASLFPKARVDAIDAEAEGAANARGSNITRAIAANHGLNVHVHRGFSPWDVPRALAHLSPGSVDLAFIDGMHTDEAQFMDFAVLHPYVHTVRSYATLAHAPALRPKLPALTLAVSAPARHR